MPHSIRVPAEAAIGAGDEAVEQEAESRLVVTGGPGPMAVISFPA